MAVGKYIYNGGAAWIAGVGFAVSQPDYPSGINGNYYGLNPDYFAGSGSGPETVSTPNPSVSSGVNPIETSYSLYGHTVPLSLGKRRIGGEIISGPWVENGLASFIISFGVPADHTETLTLSEIAFDSEVAWTGTLTGSGTPSLAGFSSEPFTVRFYDGKLTQPADTLETTHFGSDAVAYRPQILLAFSNLPIANTKFGKIPYVSALVEDASGPDVNIGTAFETLAYSLWVGYTSDQFETSGITDGLVNGGFIITQQTEFLSLIRQFGRFYPGWDILQTDKLRIVDRGAVVEADINLNKDRLMDRIVVLRQGADTVKKDLELSTIDPDADYTIVNSTAQRPHDPVAVTTSIGKDSAYLPIIMDSSTRIAIATLAKYNDEQIRKTITGTALAYGLQIEPGALVAIADLSDDFSDEVFKVVETLHGANNVVEFTAAAILRCTAIIANEGEPPPTDPDQLTGLIGRWDASVLASLDLTGANINSIADQSGNGLTMTWAGFGKPTYNATGFNGLPCVEITTAVGSALEVTGFPMGTGKTMTCFVVCTRAQASSNADHARYLAYAKPGSADYDNIGSWSLSDGSGDLTKIFVSRNATVVAPIPATIPNGYEIVIATVSTNGAITIYVDGVATSCQTVAGPWVSGGAFSVGRQPTFLFGGHYITANFAEWGVATGYINAGGAAQLYAGLKAKWGL